MTPHPPKTKYPHLFLPFAGFLAPRPAQAEAVSLLSRAGAAAAAVPVVTVAAFDPAVDAPVLRAYREDAKHNKASSHDAQGSTTGQERPRIRELQTQTPSERGGALGSRCMVARAAAHKIDVLDYLIS